VLKSRFLSRAFGKLSRMCDPGALPVLPKVILPKGEFSSHLNILRRQDALDFITRYHSENVGDLTFLDVGGRSGEFRGSASGFKYQILEIDETQVGTDLVIGDICHCPHLADESYDIVFSHNVFEHILEPWRAAEECVRLVKPGGLLIHMAPFAWRYHPVPLDCYRYTHTGLAHLFERGGQVKTEIAGYDISNRRKNATGGKMAGGLDIPPKDELGGWREHWLTVYVGRKIQ